MTNSVFDRQGRYLPRFRMSLAGALLILNCRLSNRALIEYRVMISLSENSLALIRVDRDDDSHGASRRFCCVLIRSETLYAF